VIQQTATPIQVDVKHTHKLIAPDAIPIEKMSDFAKWEMEQADKAAAEMFPDKVPKIELVPDAETVVTDVAEVVPISKITRVMTPDA
jgi:hypothetical protein